MSTDDEVAAWLLVADRDCEAARILLGAEPPQRPVAVFHLQQFAEKLLKAVLVSEGTHPPHSHDLRKLAALAETRRSEIAALGDLKTITSWATLMRYPDDDPFNEEALPTLDEIDVVFEASRALRATF